MIYISHFWFVSPDRVAKGYVEPRVLHVRRRSEFGGEGDGQVSAAAASSSQDLARR